MNCQKLDDILELYLIGELAPDEAAAATEHLAACAHCQASLAAARARLATLEAALATHRASPGFTDHTMARVVAQVRPQAVAEPAPDSWRTRLFRYAALAAAAALFVVAGYGFLRRQPTARLEDGVVAVAGPNARSVRADTPLSAGDVLATPADRRASLALAGGRLRVRLEPRTVIRIPDPNSGTAVHLMRGEMYCRASGDGQSPVVAAPLARVAPENGIVSVHVTPHAKRSAAAGQFQGTVTLVAHDGGARVLLSGRRPRQLQLARGQVLTLRTDGSPTLARPVSLDQVRGLVERNLREVMTRHGELELRRDLIAARRHHGSPVEQLQLLRAEGELEEVMRRTRAAHTALNHRLELLDRCEAQGKNAFRLVVRPAPRSR